MKIIFSRKGFDTSNGGFPNLILPDGTMFAIPIPDKKQKFRYGNLDFTYEGENIFKIINDVTNNRIKYSSKKKKRVVTKSIDYCTSAFTAHNDPFFHKEFGYFLGQQYSAQGHLDKNNVGKGDLFLFFGNFREIEKDDGQWQFVRNKYVRHVLFGWLQIDNVTNLNDFSQKEKLLQTYPFLESHPHINYNYPKNTLYSPSTKAMEINGTKLGVKGSGQFKYSASINIGDPCKQRLTAWVLSNIIDSEEYFSRKVNIVDLYNKYNLIELPRTIWQEIILDMPSQKAISLLQKWF
jgi:hypothetical protein